MDVVSLAREHFAKYLIKTKQISHNMYYIIAVYKLQVGMSKNCDISRNAHLPVLCHVQRRLCFSLDS